MVHQIERLTWDSEFFGVPIGQVDLDAFSISDLVAIEDEAEQRGIRCLYGAMDPADVSKTYEVQQHGYRFVEAAQLFSMRPEDIVPAPPVEATVRTGTPDDLPELADAIEVMAPWSRFAVDPHFGLEAARRMHEAWIGRAAAQQDGWLVLVAEDSVGIESFLTMHRTSERQCVDTIGTTRRGAGGPWLLIERARNLAGDELLLGGPIAARNVACVRWVEKVGYRLTSVRYLYHRWLDEPIATG